MKIISANVAVIICFFIVSIYFFLRPDRIQVHQQQVNLPHDQSAMALNNLNQQNLIMPNSGLICSPSHVPSSSDHTKISLSNESTNLLQCSDQAKCIVPELQLQKKFKIYLCGRPVRQGARFRHMIWEGLGQHPNVQLLLQHRDMNQADYIVYLPGSAPWHLSECNDTTLAPRMIVLDEYDGHTLVSPTMNSTSYVQAYGKVDAPWYFMYFKRSFVQRTDGIFKGYPYLSKPDVYPMTYAIADAHIQHQFNFNRVIDITCTLRGSKTMTTRQRALDWTVEYGKTRAIPKERIFMGEHGRQGPHLSYNPDVRIMRNSTIVITVNPAHREGDVQFWEAMGSGALIFVDPIFAPYQFPLLDGEHVIYFSNQNKTDLFTKLDFYRAHLDIARKIAYNGYLFAMKYHRAVNLIDYILRSTHLKEAKLHNITPQPHYSYTGQFLNHEAKLQEKTILSCDRPGEFRDH